MIFRKPLAALAAVSLIALAAPLPHHADAAYAASPPSPVAPALSDAQIAAIDAAVRDALAQSGVPSAQVAVAMGGKVVLARAWGNAADGMPARPDQPYQIASNSKQFLGALILKLRDQGKLSLDDHVSQYVEGVRGGDTITIRQLLSHTAGLRDYWPQDYSYSDMQKPVEPEEIVRRWATLPLDYAPGTRWQYSNTGFVVAGLIAEKAGGAPLWDQFERELFKPLGISPYKLDDTNKAGFPVGHHRFALGPVRPATPPAHGWLWAAGELSMTASELALWDIARMERKVLPPEDWAEQETPVALTDGSSTGYGLGVSTGIASNRRFINHGGESVGFLSQNTVYPDSNVAIVVLTNADFGSVTGRVTSAIADIVMPHDVAAEADEIARSDDARDTLEALIAGQWQPERFTAHGQGYFAKQVRADYQASLSTLGPITAFDALRPPRLRGGFVNRTYAVAFGETELRLVTYAEPGDKGKWEQFIIMPAH